MAFVVDCREVQAREVLVDFGVVLGGFFEGLLSLDDEIELLVPVPEQHVLLEQELVGEIEHTDETEPESIILEQSLMIPADILT